MLLSLLTCLTVWVTYSKITRDFREVLFVTAVHYVLYLSSIYPGECDKAHLHLCCSFEGLALEPAVGQAASAPLLQGRDPNLCISSVKLLYPKCGRR